MHQTDQTEKKNKLMSANTHHLCFADVSCEAGKRLSSHISSEINTMKTASMEQL